MSENNNIPHNDEKNKINPGFFAAAWRRVKKALTGVALAVSHWAVSIWPFKKSNSKSAGDTGVYDKTQVFDSAVAQKNDHMIRKNDHTRPLPHISKEHLSGEGKEHITMFKHKRRQPSTVIGIILTSFKLMLICLFMIGAAGFGTLVGIAKAYMETTPTLDTAEIEDQSETSYIYDLSGKLITTYTGTENRDWASIEEIPLMLQYAVVAIEDVRFNYHSGVDIKRLVGAFINNLMNSNVQGGSTITQQLVKNSLLSSERTYKRKIQEAYLAMQLEQEYNKDEILESYLNTINLGGTNYGVKTAAMDYFGKNLNELTLRECAMLAGITQYPYKYNPRRCYYQTDNADAVDDLNERTDNVLRQMYIAGFITKEDYDDARADDVTVIEESTVNEMYEMPYFVEYAVYDVITHMLDMRDLQDTDANRAAIENEIRTGGYKIYTTVDRDVQLTLEQSLAEWDAYPELDDPSESVIRYENSDGTVTEIIQPQAAAVILDQKTGQIKAIVGGRTTPTAKKTLNRAYQTSMPVGSSIKPIAVYAPAIDLGASDGTVVPNLPLAIDGWDADNGYPSGGSKYYGPVTLRTGLVRSLNSATAYTLLNLVGIENSYNYLLDLGINPKHIQKTGSDLALGTAGITPIEMAGAYATIANGGVYLEPLSFIRVEDSDGNIIMSADDADGVEGVRQERKVFDESTAWLVTDMLVNAVESGTGKRAKIDGMTVGGKTGTNQNSKGVFFAGITPYYTATLWIGHDQYEPLDNDVSASNSSAPLWQYFMSKILEGKEDAKIIDADYTELGLIKKRVCAVTGLLATEACEQDPGGHTPVDAYFVAGTEPKESCYAHELYTVCLESGKIATDYCPKENTEIQGLLFLEDSSIYWKLTQAQREKYLPGMFRRPEGFTLSELTPDMPEYYNYYCDIHTYEWYVERQALEAAITAANAQIAESQAVLANPDYAMSAADRQSLIDKISELEAVMALEDVTSAMIVTATVELKTLTDTLVALYAPPEPTPTPTPTTPTPTPTTPTPTP